MTTTTNDIKDFVNLHCSSIHFLDLDRLLENLDNAGLDVLYDILDEAYEAGEEESCGYDESIRQRGYDEGYSDGYDACLEEQDE